jgi:hypothetical protein
MHHAEDAEERGLGVVVSVSAGKTTMQCKMGARLLLVKTYAARLRGTAALQIPIILKCNACIEQHFRLRISSSEYAKTMPV